MTVADRRPAPIAPPPRPSPAEASAAPSTPAGTTPAASSEPSPSIDPAYLAQIMASLARHKRYPDRARAQQEQGSVLIAFAIDRAGHVVSIDIRRGSGSAALDNAAEAMIRDADPLPPVPASYRGARLDMTFPVTFALQ